MEFYFISIKLLFFGIIIDCLNSIINYKMYYTNNGFFNLDLMIGKKSSKTTLTKILRFLYPILNEKFFIYVLIIRFAISILIFIYTNVFLNLILLVFILQLIFNIRNTYSLSGADQMRTMLLFGLFVMSLGHDYFLLGLIFIIIQVYISYFFTGFNKLKSPIWRSGNALIWVMNSELFGNMKVQKFLIRSGRSSNLILCWGTILFQLTFPIFASFPQTLFLFLIIGFIFHLTLAIISNLNDFFWTYISAYPLIYFFINEYFSC